MNIQCPLCECLLDENGPCEIAKHDGLWYHADCLKAEGIEAETDHPLVTSDRLRTSEESASPFSK